VPKGRYMQNIVILGAGGFAREVLDVFEACNAAGQDFEVQGYIVEPPYGSPGTMVNDKPILGGFDWLEQHADQIQAICAVGDPALRFRFIRQAKQSGVRFCSVIHPTAVLTRWVTIGEDVVITAGCILTNQIRIGNHVHVNLDCTIGHDAVLDDFVTLAPGVHVSGKVVMTTGCYVGTGANINGKIHIGEWSIIGAGSTIVKDVPPNTTVVGVPGQVIKTREPGWHLR
jgi:sugar O-acyltransferase (sialic acid O-acetyltransferase NeuD family)